MRDRGGLEAVKFVESIVKGGVGYKMVDVVIFGGEALLLVYEGRGAGKGIVYVAD